MKNQTNLISCRISNLLNYLKQEKQKTSTFHYILTVYSRLLWLHILRPIKYDKYINVYGLFVKGKRCINLDFLWFQPEMAFLTMDNIFNASEKRQWTCSIFSPTSAYYWGCKRNIWRVSSENIRMKCLCNVMLTFMNVSDVFRWKFEIVSYLSSQHRF